MPDLPLSRDSRVINEAPESQSSEMHSIHRLGAMFSDRPESLKPTSEMTENSSANLRMYPAFSVLVRSMVPLETSTWVHPYLRQNSLKSSRRCCSTNFSNRVPPK